MSSNMIRQHVKHTAPRALRLFVALAMVLTQLTGVVGTMAPVQAAGGSYTLNWTAADPKVNNAPYLPTYNKVPPAALACPMPSGSTGRAADPLANAVFGNPRDSVESLAPPNMALGQIVPFEVKISVSGSTAPENGVIQFTPYWLTKTTSGGDFGYDPSYRVYCAFVDTADAASIDPGANAKVDSYTSTIVNTGTSNEQIQGTIQVSGLDNGDSVIVEVWVVLKNTITPGISGNVQTGLVNARTASGDTINTGNQTVPLLRVQEFFSADADVSIVKSDSPDPVNRGGTLTYSLLVKNNSTTTIANGVTVTDNLDPNTTFVSASGATCSAVGGVVTCTVGALSPQQSVTIQIVTTVSNTAPTAGTVQTGSCTVGGAGIDLCNRASVTAITSDPNTANNSASEPTDVLVVNHPPVAVNDTASTPEDTAVTIPVLANDSDADGNLNPASLTIVTQPTNGTVTINADHTVTYTPNANYNGTDTFTYQVCDLTNLCATATVTVTVTPVNDAPVAHPDAYSTNEDTLLTVAAPGVLVNDTDLDGDTLTVSTNTQPSHGTLIQNADGSLTYTPAANYHGTDTYQYTVSDGHGGTDTTTVTITINAVNDAPDAVDDSYTTAEDTALTIVAPGVLGNDTDADGDSLTVTGYTQPAHGAVTLNPDGSFTYTPNANYNGPDSYTYTISDGHGGTDTATVNLTVTPVNDPPVALDDAYTTDEDTTLTVPAPGVLFNDSDLDGDTLTVTANTQPSHGTLTPNPDGSFTYTPNLNYNGTDSYTYTISDGHGGTASATVTISIPPVNDPPDAVDDSYATAEDTPLIIAAPGVLGNDSDLDGDPLTTGSYTQPANGTVTLNPDGSFTYTPNANYNGPDTFTYQACDNGSPVMCDTATVHITVAPVNDAPVAVDDAYTTNEDTQLTVAAPGVLGNDSDVDHDPLTVISNTPPSHGAVTQNPDGSLVYTPNANYHGPDSYTYTVSDGHGGEATAIVNITVLPVNDVPVALDDSYMTAEDTTLTIAAPGVLDNDSDLDGDTLTVDGWDQPSHGTLSQNPDGSFTYTPNANYVGPDSYMYTVTDGNGGSATATVNIMVTPVNDPPVANDDSAITNEDVPVTILVLDNDSDVDGNLDPGSLHIISGPANGTVTINGDHTITYMPNANYYGNDSFVYEVCDTEGLCDTAIVNLVVNSVNDVPVAADDAYSTPEDTLLTIPAPGVLANDTDADGDMLAVTVLTGPAHGTLSQNSDGSFSYMPFADFNGTDAYTYKACDPSGACDEATVTITVTPVNDPPVAVDDTETTPEDTPVTIPVLPNDSDVDGDPLTVTSCGTPAHGTVQVVNNQCVYTPGSNFSGTDTFTYTISDGNGGTDTATVTVTVIPVNDPPNAVDDSATTDEDTPVTIPVLGNDTDPDGDTLHVTSVTDPPNGSVVINPDGTITYTPDPNYNGPDSFEYTACDPSGACDTATVTIGVNTANDPPVANDDTATTPEDTAVTIPVLTNDSDVDGNLDPASLTIVTPPTHGTLAIDPITHIVTYTPNADYNGPDSFTYSVCDSGMPVMCDTADVNIIVTPVNDPPVALDDTLNATEDTPLLIQPSDMLGNDSDVDHDPLTIVDVTDPPNGTLTPNGDGTYTYAPDPNFCGTDTYTYTISDGQGGEATATVTIIVACVNDPPNAVDDTATTPEDSPVTIPVLGNDTDPEGNPLTVINVSDPPNGSVVINPDGTITYTPDANCCGEDTFTYTIDDGNGGTDTATVTVTVTCVNDAPVAVNDTYSTNEDTTLTVAAPGVLGNDTDVDHDPLTAILVTGPSHGTLTQNADGSFTYVPDANWNGTDSYTYKANDGNLDSNVATVTINVLPVNDPPVAVNNSYSTNEGSTLNVSPSGVLGNDTDVDGDTLTVTSNTQPANGTVTQNPDGSFSYTPNAGFAGTDTFDYTISDGHGGTDTATVTITVNDVMPSLTVTKTAGSQSVLFSGAVVTYTVKVVNTSVEPVSLTSLVDDKFGNLDMDTQAPHTWTTSTCDVPRTLAVGETYTCTFTANVAGTAGGTHTNTVTGTVTDNENNNTPGSDSETVNLFWRGRTPGYWKNRPAEWPAFSVNGVAVTPNTQVVRVFAIPSSLLTKGILDLDGDKKADTLTDALGYPGGNNVRGAAATLLRAGTAALLNEAYFGAAYPPYNDVTSLLNAVNTALASGNRATMLALATTLDGWNNGVH